MDRIVDQGWASLLAAVMKKRGILRPELGDEVDLYLPQSRLLALAESNPEIPRSLYGAAYVSAERNAGNIVKKLGMPPDYFWKFEYWPKARALTNLGQIVKRVFSSMMTQAKEGNLEVTDLDVDPLRIAVNFEGCVECAGIAGLTRPICFYHAGTLTGILAGLINRPLDSFETECGTAGAKSCRFTVGDREDEFIKKEHASYLSPLEIKTDLAARLEKSLQNQPVRTIGNLVDVNYYRLVLANVLLADPSRAALTNIEVGSQLGRKLAPVLVRLYGRDGLPVMRDYYSQLGEFKAEVTGDELKIELAVTECAEAVGADKTMEMMSFLFGELQGLASELTKKELVLKDSRFEGDKLFLTLVPGTLADNRVSDRWQNGAKM